MIIDRWDHKAAYAFMEVDQNHSALAPSMLLRDRLAEAQNWRCCYCGVVMNRWRRGDTLCTIEHVIPASAGGRVCWETCAAACHKCNTADGARLLAQWRLPLTVRLCGWCGSDDVRVIEGRAYRCGSCRHQYAVHGDGSGPLSPVLFGSLRRAAGEIIVSDAGFQRIADRLRNKIISNLRFTPYVLAETLMRLASPVINAARLRSDCLVEIYDETVSELRRKYTPDMAAAPERAPLARIASQPKLPMASCSPSVSPAGSLLDTRNMDITASTVKGENER